MTSSMLYLHMLSPLHCGMGQGSGLIDLPVVRETTTAWPEIPGSTVKGVLRDACGSAGVDSEIIDIVFGPGVDSTANSPSDHSGGLWLSSGQLLCFPVRSFRGTFVWVTCGHALSRWQRTSELIGQPNGLSIPFVDDDATIHLSVDADTVVAIDGKVLLEDLDLSAATSRSTDVDAIARTIAASLFPGSDSWQSFFRSHFGIVSDDVFGFLTRTATEVRARIRIDDDRKTVADGQLWYEETVPIETIFVLPLQSTTQGEARLQAKSQHFSRLIDVVGEGIARPIQIGGNATVGNGLAAARLAANGAA